MYVKRACLVLILILITVACSQGSKSPALPNTGPDLQRILQAPAPTVTTPGLPAVSAELATATPVAPASRQDQILSVESAIQAAINSRLTAAPALQIFRTQISNTQVSTDGAWSTAWLSPLDPQTGQVVPAEPGLAVSLLVNGRWVVVLPGESNWVQAVQAAPDQVLAPALKSQWLEQYGQAQAAPSAGTLSDYLLPWSGGDTMYLTQSVGHDRYDSSGYAHYAFDFAKPGYPSGMFEVYAAKAGVVKRAVWTNQDHDHSAPNYIVLEDDTTNPVTYMLYMHFSQNSIPVALRTAGTQVYRGQLLGIADDTGVSSGNHLHFMVHTNPSSYWGRSVDITFDDVNINGGRPRISSDLAYCRNNATYQDVCDSTRSAYISGNTMHGDHTPPSGGILAPQTGQVVTVSPLHLSGSAVDKESGLGAIQFLARYNGSWHDLGSILNTGLFSYDWDLCAPGVPAGPISLALRLRDKDGNLTPGLPGLTHFINAVACPAPPPACVPSASQVALFSQPGYQGACALFSSGSYNNGAALGAVGAGQAASIQVGSGVQATLFFNLNKRGRGETFTADDSNLADNWIGAQTVSSMLVQARSAVPAVPLPSWPVNNSSLPAANAAGPSVSLAWDNAGGGSEFQAVLSDNGLALASPWQAEPVWHLGSLPPGAYTWQVMARNSAGTSAWSSLPGFTVAAPPAGSQDAAVITAPFTDTVENGENGWTYTGWKRITSDNRTPGGSTSWAYQPASGPSYNTSAANSGDLTSPPIRLPDSPPMYLHFYYDYQTEGPGIHWDQRWVQIAVDGGPFTNTLQLGDDPPDSWLAGPPISLVAFAGRQVQVRFHFETLDKELNSFKGWHIDDFSINASPPPSCSHPLTNLTAALAAPITAGTPVNGILCPPGSQAYYHFQAFAGDQIGALASAQSLGSSLDTVLTLLDSDGRSVLAENDDLVHTVQTDSALTYTVARSGDYYLKLRAWDHPSGGGESYFYTLKLFNEKQAPTAAFTFPTNGAHLPSLPITLTVAASDISGGISHVRFYWHSEDWQNGDWQALGETWNGQAGWQWRFDQQPGSHLPGAAFYAQVFDWAGNWTGTGVWNVSTGSVYLPRLSR